jgi:hypothetical protein
MSSLCCPFCAHERPEFVSNARGASMHCPECGATGPLAAAGERSHAAFIWNQRYGCAEFGGPIGGAQLPRELLH